VDRFAIFEGILARRCNLRQAVVLDFGCGAGGLVRSALARGIDCYGCDIDFSRKWTTEAELIDLLQSRRVRQIPGARENVSPEAGQPYRLPFDDGMFDVVISDQVMEHVRNYPDVIREFARVLRPGGLMLHMFPSRYRLVEPHQMVPFASFFRPWWWLKLWARLGVRNRFQKGMPAREVADYNRHWLVEHTNYLTVAELRRLFAPAFALEFVEREFMQYGRARWLGSPWLYRTLFSRIMLGARVPDTATPARPSARR
jgi:SAM-dependent methyltransferase